MAICRATRKICFLAICRHRATVTFFPDDAGLSYLLSKATSHKIHAALQKQNWNLYNTFGSGGGRQIGESVDLLVSDY